MFTMNFKNPSPTLRSKHFEMKDAGKQKNAFHEKNWYRKEETSLRLFTQLFLGIQIIKIWFIKSCKQRKRMEDVFKIFHFVFLSFSSPLIEFSSRFSFAHIHDIIIGAFKCITTTTSCVFLSLTSTLGLLISKLGIESNVVELKRCKEFVT